MLLLIPWILLVAMAHPPLQARYSEPSDCPLTPSVKDRPPDDPRSSRFETPNATWFANKERTLWAWWWGKTSAGGYKVLWVRPVGAELKIKGRRLDAEVPAVSARIPDGYRQFSYQASLIEIPGDGCWEIESTAGGDALLKFVVRIH